jgi:hypothetical protein
MPDCSVFRTEDFARIDPMISRLSTSHPAHKAATPLVKAIAIHESCPETESLQE